VRNLNQNYAATLAAAVKNGFWDASSPGIKLFILARHKKTEPPPSGNPAISWRPVAFRPRFAAGLALSDSKFFALIFTNGKQLF
jgi:hypothetical protein